MIPWQLLDSAKLESGGELRLYQRGQEFSVRIDGQELMNSRAHGSEEALAELACERVAKRRGVRVLVGGLGMGFTLAAALHKLPPQAGVVVAELSPSVVTWNRGPLAHLAGNPLMDARVSVHEGDVADLMRSQRGAFDAILLDVDNGPEGLTQSENDWLYGRAGLSAAHAALRAQGVLAVWSAKPHRPFAERLSRAGFAVEEHTVKARGARGGSKHTIWLAVRSGKAG